MRFELYANGALNRDLPAWPEALRDQTTGWTVETTAGGKLLLTEPQLP